MDLLGAMEKLRQLEVPDDFQPSEELDEGHYVLTASGFSISFPAGLPERLDAHFRQSARRIFWRRHMEQMNG